MARNKYRRELTTIALLATALFLTLSVISHRAHDPSWFCTHTAPMPVKNWCGVLGAHVSALLFYLFGSAALVVPVIFAGIALRMTERLAALTATAVLFATWCGRYQFSGGLLGQSLARLLVRWLNPIGTFLVLHGLLFVSALVLFRISFTSIVRWCYKRRGVPAKAFNSFLSLIRGTEIKKEDIFAFETGQPAPEHVIPATTAASDTNPEPTLPAAPVGYSLPELTLFDVPEVAPEKIADEHKQKARLLEEKLACFGIEGSISAIRPGPVVTLYEYEPAIDTKLSKIVALEDDLALALQATSIRILAPMPGTAVVGFEVANQQRKSVYFGSIIRSKEYKQSQATLPLILGQLTTGTPVVADLARMPHLLVAGSTGSGKSVALHAMVVNLLCAKKPEELKLILIDPKRLEFACYADISHLLFPIVTDSRMAVGVLRWMIQLMEARYVLMARCNVRSVAEYQQLVEQPEPMPYLVCVIDEFADLMMTGGSDVEDHITRLSQMARAAGIHLILATQRPSVDVITGLIKVNFPSRIALRVTSKIDSRTILDCAGADKLLGRGDQLFLDGTTGQLHRIHGAYVSDKEIQAVVQHVRAQQPPAYLSLETVLKQDSAALHDTDDELYQQILSYLTEVDEESISMVQRRFRIGYNRSARIIEALESQGRILPAEGSKPRRVVKE